MRGRHTAQEGGEVTRYGLRRRRGAASNPAASTYTPMTAEELSDTLATLLGSAFGCLLP